MIDRGNGARRYTVHCSAAVTDAIRRVHRQATSQGRGKAVTRAFRQILRRLELDPFQVGEPTYRLPGLRLRVRTVLVRPLVIDFAIHEDQPLVFIRIVKLLSE
jgi:hypothetical protein